MNQTTLFTSESVSEGHPDKVADQISDAILDEILRKDLMARVACETMVKTGMVLIAGEITTSAWVDIEAVTRQTINEIGYNSPEYGFTGDSCAILTAIGKQSADISLGVDHREDKQLGAGDQGLMFGYATNETEVLMPAPITYAHRLMKQKSVVRKSRKLPWLRPDGKSQVTVRYQNGKPVGVDAIVISTQHDPDVNHKTVIEGVMEEIIKPVIPADWLDAKTRYYINPTGRFVIGGPMGDCGLTGRKIIVDSYGGMAHHGGGCFSGKDPSKVDRSGSYMARYVAKNIVAAGLASRCEIQISYAIGVAEPTSVMVESYGTSRLSNEALEQLVREHFDLTPGGIIKTLNLLQPIYRQTAAYGHFGRQDVTFSWEQTDKAAELKG